MESATDKPSTEPRCADCGHGTLAHNAIGGACTQCDCGRFRAAPAQCRRCKRHNLRTAASRALGIGPRCAAIEAATAGLNDEQAAKALEAIADGAVVRTSRPGIANVVSDDGTEVYVTAASGHCSCKWGARRISATTKTCWHVAAVLLDATPRRAATRRLFVLSA